MNHLQIKFKEEIDELAIVSNRLAQFGYVASHGALDLLEMLEAMAKSVLVAVQLGRVEYIPDQEIKNLDNVCKVRNLPYPGKPGEFNSLVQAYKE